MSYVSRKSETSIARRFDDPAAVEGAPQKIAYEFRRIRDDIERLFRQWYQDELATQLEGKFLISN